MPVGQDTIAAVLTGLEGRRAVLAGGWASIDPSAMPKDVLRIEHAPYGWLIPRVSVAVHHAGAPYDPCRLPGWSALGTTTDRRSRVSRGTDLCGGGW